MITKPQPKSKPKRYYVFPIELGGLGNTPEEAWNDATEAFTNEPGPTPDEYRVEEIEEEND
jgi:hypothetical protein